MSRAGYRSIVLKLIYLALFSLFASPSSHSADVGVLNDLTVQLFLKGDIAKARDAAQNALNVARTEAKTKLELCIALGNLAEIQRASGNLDKSDDLFAEAAQTYIALGSDFAYYLPAVLNNWGRLKGQMEQFAAATALFDHSLNLRKKLYPKDVENYSITQNNLADNYLAAGNSDGALAAFQETILMVGAPAVQVAYALRRQGELLLAIDKEDKATAVLESSLKTALNAPFYNATELGRIYWVLGRAQAQIGRYQAALTSFEAAIQQLEVEGNNRRFILDVQLEQCSMLRLLDRWGEIDSIMSVISEIANKEFANDENLQANIYTKRALIVSERGDVAAGEQLFRKALEIWERLEKPRGARVAGAMSSLGIALQWQGRNDEALIYLRAALGVAFDAGLSDASMYALLVENLSNYYRASLSYKEAETLISRALAILEKAGQVDSADYGELLVGKGNLLRQLGRAEEGVAALERAIPILTAANARRQQLALAHDRLGSAYFALNDFAKAGREYRSSIAQWGSVTAANAHPLAVTLSNLAQLHDQIGDSNTAETLFKDAIQLLRQWELPLDLDMATIQYEAGFFYSNKKNYMEASKHYAIANRIAIGRLQEAWAFAANDALVDFDREIEGAGFFAAILNQTYLAPPTIPQAKAQASQLMQLAQWTDIARSAFSLGAASARWSVKDETSRAMIRRRQDLSFEVSNFRRRMLTLQLSEELTEPKRRELTEVKEKSHFIMRAVADLDAHLKSAAPDFMQLAFPAPLSAPEVQNLLRPDEALVYIQVTRALRDHPEETLVWIVTKNDISLSAIQPGYTLISKIVQILRCGLDRMQWMSKSDFCANLTQSSWDGEGPLPYRLDIAHQLYEILLGRFEEKIVGKRLFIVAPGPLATIPFEALVTEAPVVALPENWEGYRGINWLVQDRVISMLPSVGTLRFLRGRATPTTASRPFVGFGDPKLSGNEQCAPVEPFLCEFDQATVRPVPKAPERRSLSGAIPNMLSPELQTRVAFVNNLCPVPETGEELRCISRLIAPDKALIVTGPEFDEARLRQMSDRGDLEQYRAIAFATHGLLPDESQSLGNSEPALVATPGQADDGLITATEIGRLRLNAAWILLAACNTASGTGGADGLANAFFYAGARAILISHWEANAGATAYSISMMMKNDPTLVSMSDAHRAAEMALSANPPRQDFAHPSVWAAFTVIGDGLSR